MLPNSVPSEVLISVISPFVPPFPERPIATATNEPSGEKSTELTRSPPPTSTLIEP